jgi:ubiquinol-cytochrome c reductase cytochrome c1 subunit
MMRRITILAALVAGFALLAAGASAKEDKKKEAPSWSFQGIFGTYDKAQLKRGFEVYQGVCAACHSLRLVAYRNLKEFGLSIEEIEKIAAEREVPGEPNEEGEPQMRNALPSDKFVPPFANANAARAANNGALPPDISVMAKARLGGVNYLYAYLTGFVKPPKYEVDTEGRIVKDKNKKPIPFKLGDGQQYNAVFPGGKTAMAFPLSEGAVEYSDKTKATVEQMTLDVIAFMQWAADPKLEDRKRLGVKAILFLILLSGLLYAWKRKVWANVH